MTATRCRSWLLAAALLATVVFSMPVPARADFVTGDLYLLSVGAPGIGQAILRVDPATGVTSGLSDIPDAPAVRETLSYDAFRDRLL